MLLSQPLLKKHQNLSFGYVKLKRNKITKIRWLAHLIIFYGTNKFYKMKEKCTKNSIALLYLVEKLLGLQNYFSFEN